MENLKATPNVNLEIINWLEVNLRESGMRKIELAERIGVSKQAVTKWFARGLISKENLIKVSKLFKTTPPLDLLSIEPNGIVNPLAYEWTPAARSLVALLMEDQKTARGRAKINSLLKVYDVINTQCD